MKADWLTASILLLPLATAAGTALLARRPRPQQALSFIGSVGFVLCALAVLARSAQGEVQPLSFGNWPAGMGIGFALDRLGSALVAVAAVLGLACFAFLASTAGQSARGPMVLPLMHGTLAGVAGAFATADLFNLYVWFELMLICALGLLAVGGRRDQLDACFRYLGMNLVGTLLLLLAVGLIYAATGQLGYAALTTAWPAVAPEVRTVLLAMLGLALLLKSAAFPLAAWLPAAYPSLPAPVLALFAGLLTKVGVYALLRLLGDVLAPLPGPLLEALGWIAVATMASGVLGAAYHWDLRRILAFHIISQIGYILLAVALGSPAGDAAALFYTVHHILVKANLFLIAGMIATLTGSHDLRRIGGLARARPGLALLFAIPALSLVGIPPLSGFWAKLLVLQAALAADRYVWAAAALLVSLLTLYSMMKIWMEAFWKPRPEAAPEIAVAGSLAPAWGAIGGLAALTAGLGLAPDALVTFAQAAALSLGGR
ncbi:multisubunit sodium/proton antiporter MrpD subunit [Tibeticola sediminis]|uniref:Multisubunit sodium/proton antiporter MrpD subunit n=1 Tax=Tibeticola sediminis TaxID=1917811 RepID=A0A3N4UI17_9BURK|nr:proton-conducting transporter membrane subunit [Tibeticola sediminis]RPE66941.1 multisubunit sodium/proton antiporter MrpD subunit [Tibeticola sediminis]